MRTLLQRVSRLQRAQAHMACAREVISFYSRFVERTHCASEAICDIALLLPRCEIFIYVI